jgi:L-threonylcarbamoyladenylate synthase
VGVESTIVDCTTPAPQILRPGGIPNEHISALLGGAMDEPSGPSRAPGMLASHYAPRAQVILADSANEAAALLAGHPGSCLVDGTADLPAYAQQLYALLRDADTAGTSTVIAVMPPAAGLGHAIRDRLTKAAAGRPR